MSTDVLRCLLIICFCSYGTPSLGERPCEQSWEIGTPQVMLCNGSFTDVVTLQLGVNNEFVNISSCNVLEKCTDYMAPVYKSKYFVELGGKKVSYMVVYTSTARKNDTTFRCVYDEEATGIGCIGMFVRPSKPVCEPLALVNSNTQIRISCASHKVFPSAVMEMIALKSGTVYFPDNYVFDWDRNISSSPAHPGYYVVHFTVRILLSTLEPSPYQIQVRMFPEISNKTLAQEKSSETALLSIVFTAPEVRISDDCPLNSYITSGTCKCELPTPGNPPGQARWYTQSGQVVGTENSEDRSSTLTVSHGTADPSPSYWCQAVTVLNVSSPSKALFSPKLAFGPKSVIIETSDEGTFNLCPSEERVTTVTCKVETEYAKPGVTMTIIVNSDVVVDRSEGKITGHYYVQDYIFRPSKPGSYSVICRAENVLSSQLAISKSYSFVVREPPSSAPVFLIPGNMPKSKMANVTSRQKVGIICKVDGGYPQVQKITITCGSRSEQVQGKLAVLNLEITTSMDGLMCHCAAQHASGCYDKESIVLLQVQGRPTPTRSEKGDGLTKELIIGVASAAVLTVAVVIGLILLCKRKTRRANDVGPGNPKDDNYPVQSGTELHEYLTTRDPVDTDYYTVINHYDYVIHPSAPADDSGSYNPYSQGRLHLSY